MRVPYRYLEAWSKWRVTRDSNNLQVKRSREKARQRAKEAEAVKTSHQRELKQLQQSVVELTASGRRVEAVLATTQQHLRLALRACFAPSALTPQDRLTIQSLLRGMGDSTYLPQA